MSTVAATSPTPRTSDSSTLALAKQSVSFLQELEKQHLQDRQATQGSPRPLATTQNTGFDADKAGFDDANVYPHLIPNDTLVKFDAEDPDTITHATLKALVVQLTSADVVDYSLVCDFFLTYRLFVTGDRVMQMVTARLVWAVEACRSLNSQKQHHGQLVVVRTFVVLRHWLLNYFADDFVPHPTLGDALVATLNHITTSGLVTAGDGLEAKVLVDLKVHWLTMVSHHAKLYTDIDDLVQTNRMLEYELPPPPRLAATKADPTWRRSAMLSLYDHPPVTAPGSLQRLMLRHQSSQLSLPQQLDDYSAKLVAPTTTTSSHQPPHSHMNLVDSSRPQRDLLPPPESPKDPRPATVGFATNGQVKLPSASVAHILPPTPVRKMEPSPSPSLVLAPPPKFDADGDITRRSSLKKIVDGWKRTLAALPHPHSPKMPSSNSEQTITSVRTITSAEPVPVTGNRMDVLAARIVDELELMVEYYAQPPPATEPAPATDSEPTPAPEPSRKSPFGAALIRDPIATDDPVASMVSVASAASSPAPSFQQPASINWSEDVPFDSDDPHDSAIKVTIPKSDLYLDFSSVFDDNAPHHASYDDSVSTPSNISQYSHDVADLGIAASPAKYHPSASRYPSGDRSRASYVSGRRDSAKSYLSYDSALSVSREVVVMEQLGGLRKKHGYANLRSATDHRQSSSSLVPRPRSLRISALCALTELPFPETPTATNTDANCDANDQRDPLKSDPLKSDASSIFSVAVRSRLASMRGQRSYGPSEPSTTSAAIPGISSYVLKQLAAIPDESIAADPVEFTLNKLEGRSPATDVIAEVIADDDEVDVCIGPDDVAHVRHLHHHVRLVAQHQSVASELEDSSPLAAADNTTDIMRAINQANTLDIDDSASVHTPEPPLTPHKYHFGTSTPRASVGESALEEPAIDVSILANQPPPPLEIEPQLAAPFLSPGHDSSADEQFHSTRNTLQSQQSAPENASIFKSPAAAAAEVEEEPQLSPVPQFDLGAVIDAGTHVSFIHNYPAKMLAIHFTAIERDIIQDIDWKDLIEHKWNRDLAPVNSWLEIIANDDYYTTNQGVNLVIARFNLMVNWVISEVLLTKSQQERVGLMSRMIHVAHHCLVLQNYSTLMQVVLALTSEKLHRLKDTWMHLPPGDILMLKNLEELTSPLKNFLNLRIAINTMTPSQGCIPFVGLYLSDLIFNAERPTFIKAPAASDNGDKLINFSKFRTSVHIVRSLSQCIEWSGHYHLDMVPEVLSRCLYIKSLDEDEMNFCLDHIDDP